jgi:uncharacterized membrane protein YphA (DoxX/SURF4 family)
MKNALNNLLFGSATSGSRTFEIAYALFRFYCGFSIAIGAGLSKVFHKIDENGGTDWANLAFGVPDWFVKQVGDIGFTFISPQFWATLAVYGEFVGGLLIAVGLLTRFSALQMAFQFFVVAFIWYSTPEPFAMYYQQLIFWSFVLIAAVGGGRFSLDHWLARRRFSRLNAKPSVVLSLFLLFSAPVFAQSNATPARVRFTITNPTMKSRELEIRCFDYSAQKRIGYGCSLGPLQSRSDNKPVGTRIYLKRSGQWELAFVLSAQDDGRKIDLSKTYEITREQWLQVAYDEQNERTAALENIAQNPDTEAIARARGLSMVTFKISGKALVGKQVHVRAQLPWVEGRSNEGFSRRLSRFDAMRVSFPVGTKIYLCDGPYWNGPVPEKLLFTVDSEKANYLVRI